MFNLLVVDMSLHEECIHLKMCQVYRTAHCQLHHFNTYLDIYIKIIKYYNVPIKTESFKRSPGSSIHICGG